ncbi:MAG: hypothetical protein ACE5GB_03265 [Acidimicrobiales bacterium]
MSQSSLESSRAGGYRALVVVLIVFGVVAGFSIGIPFLFMGLILAVMSPLRGRPAAFWPPIAAILGFIAGYAVVAPLRCTSTSSSDGGQFSTTVCDNIIGLDYSGSVSYEPSLGPALSTGLGVAVVAAIVTRLALRGGASGPREER